jgi:hypothetical protein
MGIIGTNLQRRMVMENTEIVDAMVEPLADPNYKGVFVGIALVSALIAGGVAAKSFWTRKKNRPATTEVEAKADTE